MKVKLTVKRDTFAIRTKDMFARRGLRGIIDLTWGHNHDLSDEDIKVMLKLTIYLTEICEVNTFKDCSKMSIILMMNDGNDPLSHFMIQSIKSAGLVHCGVAKFLSESSFAGGL